MLLVLSVLDVPEELILDWRLAWNRRIPEGLHIDVADGSRERLQIWRVLDSSLRIPTHPTRTGPESSLQNVRFVGSEIREGEFSAAISGNSYWFCSFLGLHKKLLLFVQLYSSGTMQIQWIKSKLFCVCREIHVQEATAYCHYILKKI